MPCVALTSAQARMDDRAESVYKSRDPRRKDRDRDRDDDGDTATDAPSADESLLVERVDDDPTPPVLSPAIMGGEPGSFRGLVAPTGDRGAAGKYKRTRNGLRLKCRHGSDVRVVAMSKATTFRELYTRLVHDYGFDLKIRCVCACSAVVPPHTSSAHLRG